MIRNKRSRNDKYHLDKLDFTTSDRRTAKSGEQASVTIDKLQGSMGWYRVGVILSGKVVIHLGYWDRWQAVAK